MGMQLGESGRGKTSVMGQGFRYHYKGMGRNQKKDIYIQRKDDKNGKKRYSYTSKKPKGADRA